MSIATFPPPNNAVWFATMPVAVITATGDDAVDLLNRLGTQDVKDIKANETRFGFFVTHQGKLVAQVRFVAVEGALWLVTDALMGKPLADWLEKYTITEDASFAVVDESWPAWRLVSGDAAGRERVQAALAAHAPLCVGLPRGWGDGMDILLAEPERASATFALDGLGIREVSHEERERARIAVGEPAIGHDLAPLSPPLEWRLGKEGISWTKGCFVGQEVLGRLDNFNKVARLSMGLRGEAGAAALATPEARAAARLVIDGSVVGKVTSVAPAGKGDGFVALALVKREAARPGDGMLRLAPEQELPISFEDRPFWA